MRVDGRLVIDVASRDAGALAPRERPGMTALNRVEGERASTLATTGMTRVDGPVESECDERDGASDMRREDVELAAPAPAAATDRR